MDTNQSTAGADLALDDFVLDNDAIYTQLAHQLGIQTWQVASFASLYDDGQSVPFIARYRKDKTGGLDDTVLRQLEKKLDDERELATRRHKIKQLLSNQNALTDELSERIHHAQSKLELEEIYAPYRPRRRSLATKARLAGLDVPAKKLMAGASLDEALADYQPVATITDETGEQLEVDYSSRELQIAGMGAIIIDEWAMDLDLLDKLRQGFYATAHIHSTLESEEKRAVGEKFKDYFEHSESFAKLSGHRLLAMLRGRHQNILHIKVVGEDEPFIAQIIAHVGATSGDDETADALQSFAKKLWTDKWRPHLDHRILTEHRLRAEREAIDVFASNLQHLLMAAPAGQQVILGVDPGIRHGVKMAVIDDTGNVLATKTVYPFAPKNQYDEAANAIGKLIATYQVTLVAIGNGTASRETEKLVKDTIKHNHLNATALVVSEAGASVYSASELAGAELGELDVSLRGAVSIARRLQDPLSELVKVEPKAIGVGQYQHDVNQSELEQSLAHVTEDCVNQVGVDVNTASPSILSYIAGLNKNVAEQIVNYRREHGAFDNREQLKRVPRLGEKTFLQAAGFLRIKSGSEPLDATGVHPESYELIYRLLDEHHITVDNAIGNSELIAKLGANAAALSQESLALMELGKARHDPRGKFVTANFRDDINSIKDLTIGMQLEGVVTNVTAFGCFVDIGVHQDGMVHISELSDDFVANPSAIVKPFDIVAVRVIGIDETRGRINLSMKKDNRNAVYKDKTDDPSPKSTQHQASPKASFAKANTDKPNQTKSSQAKSSKTNHQSANTAKEQATKVGSLGALLQQAGLSNKS